MSMKTKISKACEKANHVCDKNQYKEATFMEKIKLSLHLLYCKACRKYSNNNHKLSKTMQEAKVNYMHKSEKEALKENLTEIIHEQQN